MKNKIAISYDIFWMLVFGIVDSIARFSIFSYLELFFAIVTIRTFIVKNCTGGKSEINYIHESILQKKI